jgi:uncharacterized protein YecE (DUF72 family)
VTAWVGTSGWQYRDWRGRFYPERLATARWLEHYVERFATVEVNNTFYMLPPASTFARWAERTPADFVVTVKANRYLTHVRRLRDPDDAVRRFLDAAAPLGAKLGPVLVQLPPNLPADLGRLDATLAAFAAAGAGGLRVAVEPRHETWFTDATYDLLAHRGAALVLADRRNRPTPVVRTAPWAYLRLHEGRASPRPCYGRAAIEAWADRLAATWSTGEDVYAYTNNDPGACAPRDAALLALALARRGFPTTRVPVAAHVRVG